MADASFKGAQSPKYHTTKHDIVEPKIITRKFVKPINPDVAKTPAFLRIKKATDKISPVSHNTLTSFKSTLPAPRFYINKGKTKTYVEEAPKTTKYVPGVGHYPIKNIENAYKFITKGAGKGWK